MIEQAIKLPGGGVSKVNIATDLEQAALGARGRRTHELIAQDPRGLSTIPTRPIVTSALPIGQRHAFLAHHNCGPYRGRPATIVHRASEKEKMHEPRLPIEAGVRGWCWWLCRPPNHANGTTCD
jgi:hypothetical protein